MSNSANRIDSNVTGLRFCEEASLKTLPGSAVWYPLEPNGYNDFGGDSKLVARSPINPSRQRQKGVITDLDAKGGFTQDFTQNNSWRLLQGFMFADVREKLTSQPLNGVAIAISAVVASTKTITIASTGASYLAGMLIKASGFAQSTNNGLKTVASSSATTVVTVEAMADETTTSDAKIECVGWQFGSGEVSIDVSGTNPKLLRASGSKDFTTFGLVVGQSIFIGGDATANKFALATSNGFARVLSVAATYIELDKTQSTMVTDAGTGKTIRIFFGNVLKNESDPALIKRRTYQLERTLGEDDDGTMCEYLIGAVANEVAFQIKHADKITADFQFHACDHEQYTGATGVKSGTRPTLALTDAFNTSSDFSRIKLHKITAGSSNPSPLFAFLTDMGITIKNGISALKAVGTLGAFDLAAGMFEVSGQLSAYFNDITAVDAVRNNDDVTLDFAIAKNNAGYVLDIPLLALGDGRLKVDQDKPITIPLKTEAAQGTAGHTLMFTQFPYLPDAAE